MQPFIARPNLALQRPRRSARIACSFVALTCGSALIFAGCRRQPAAPAPTPKPAAAPVTISDADLQKFKPNEAGAIMVLMYHRFKPNEPDNDLNRRPDTFRKDLETLHQRGYFPVNLSDLVENRMDVPLGKTPIALTFDDSLPTQFRVVSGSKGQASIDPNCAVGIMETFSKANPDWPARGTFFVLPKEGRNSEPFGQVDSIAEKFGYLKSKGYEIANHTSTHSSMRGMSAQQVRHELATALRDIKQIAPQAAMQVVALPYGKLPRDKQAQQALVEGTDGGTSYKNKAVFLAAYRPILSPLTKADKKFAQGGTFCVFNPTRLERIKPDPREAKLPGTLEYWLKYFEENSGHRYVSDGSPEIAAVPASYKAMVDEAKARAQGKRLQIYGGAGSKGGSGSLSVE